MAPPAEATKPSQPAAASPFVTEEEAAPPAAEAAARVSVVPEQKVVGAAAAQPATAAAPAPSPASQATPEEQSAFERTFLDNLNLVVGGGGSFGTRVYGEPDPFSLAAQKLKGPMIFFQPSYSILATNARAEKPNGDFELRLGADIKNHFLSNSPEQSLPDSDVSALSAGLMVEPMYHVLRHFSVGANVNFGRMFLHSDNADVGAPFTATFDGDSLWNLGAQVFLAFWDGNVRASFNYDTTFGALNLDAGPGNPALRTAMDPIVGFGIGVDPLGIISTVSHGSSGDGAKEKKSK